MVIGSQAMLTLLVSALLDPRLASYVGAALAGHPSYGAQLVEICERESGCTRIGVHRCDARRSSSAWRDAVGNMRALDPARCEHHELADGPWSTSGPWGAMRAYTLRWLPGCWPAWLLDVPAVGAFAATRRAHGPTCRQVHGCARWGWS